MDCCAVANRSRSSSCAASGEGHCPARCQVRCHLHEPLHVADRVRAAAMVPIGVVVHVRHVVVEQEAGEAVLS